MRQSATPKWAILLFIVGLLTLNVFLYGQSDCDPPCETQGCPDDGNECTAPGVCTSTGCINAPEPAGTVCDFVASGDGVCDGASACVECLADSDCTDDGNDCTVLRCVDNACTPNVVAASTFCDLNGVDDGLCDGVGSCVIGDGLLGIEGISFDASSVLQVTIKNRSDQQTVPANKGNLRVFVDGHLAADIELGTLSDQSFRQVGTPQVITLDGVRIAGTDRRIGVALDTNNELIQKQEDNRFSRTVTPPAVVGPDFVISDLSVSNDGTASLQVEVRNDGTADSPAINVDLEISVNGTAMPTVTQALPPLTAGGGAIVLTPAPPIAIATDTDVAVSLVTSDPFAETDTINNRRFENLPFGAYYDFGYIALLSDPKITDNLKWENASGVVSSSNWTTEQSTDLRNAISDLERGDPAFPPLPDVSGNPSPYDLDEASAWSIFVRQIAHSLWVEKNNLVNWSLLDLPDEQLTFILDGREWFNYGLDGFYGPSNEVTPWNPATSYQFLTNLGLVKGDQLSTILAVSEWMTAHLVHCGCTSGHLVEWGFAGWPFVDRMLYPFQGRQHKTLSCGSTTGIYASLLRTINIPMQRAITELVDGPGHRRPYFLSVDLSMGHADDLHDFTYVGKGLAGNVPVGDMMFASAEMDALFLNPTLDCDGSVCNTLGEQASHNTWRAYMQLCVDRLCNRLLDDYVAHGPDHVRDVTLGSPAVPPLEFAFPLFDTAEKDAVISDIEAYITLLGDGDIEAGKPLVAERGAHPN